MTLDGKRKARVLLGSRGNSEVIRRQGRERNVIYRTTLHIAENCECLPVLFHLCFERTSTRCLSMNAPPFSHFPKFSQNAQ